MAINLYSSLPRSWVTPSSVFIVAWCSHYIPHGNTSHIGLRAQCPTGSQLNTSATVFFLSKVTFLKHGGLDLKHIFLGDTLQLVIDRNQPGEERGQGEKSSKALGQDEAQHVRTAGSQGLTSPWALSSHLTFVRLPFLMKTHQNGQSSLYQS